MGPMITTIRGIWALFYVGPIFPESHGISAISRLVPYDHSKQWYTGYIPSQKNIGYNMGPIWFLQTGSMWVSYFCQNENTYLHLILDAHLRYWCNN